MDLQHYNLVVVNFKRVECRAPRARASPRLPQIRVGLEVGAGLPAITRSAGASPFFAHPEMGSVRFRVQTMGRRPLPSAACVRPGAHSARHQDSRNDLTPCRMAWHSVSAGAHAPHSDQTPGPTPTRGRRTPLSAYAPSLPCAPPLKIYHYRQDLRLVLRTMPNHSGSLRPHSAGGSRRGSGLWGCTGTGPRRGNRGCSAGRGFRIGFARSG